MEPANPEDYIYAQGQARERVTINRFLAAPGYILRKYLEEPLGWPLPYAWLGLRIPQERLLRGFKRAPKQFRGDVDVIGGRLAPASPEAYEQCFAEMRAEDSRLKAQGPEQFRDVETPVQSLHNWASMLLVERGQLRWPPDLSRVAAAEVKVSYFSSSDDLKATGSGNQNARHQALELCRLGFDRVALIRFLVTEPVLSDDYHPWMLAGARSSYATDEYLNESAGRVRYSADDPFGTLMISVGSVPGKLEHMAGSLSGQWLHPPRDNPYRSEAAAARQAVEQTLTEVMSKYPAPRRVPVLLLACSNNSCGQIYIGWTNPDADCPSCGRPPF